MNILRLLPALLLLCCSSMAAYAQEIYMAPEDFAARHIPATEAGKSLWITGELRTLAENILGHRPLNLRQRYWQHGDRTVWILEEIGKEEPITAGFAIENDHIVETRVLIFRESRGWEIHYPAFTKQFLLASIGDNSQLDRTIDGISGATLSVNAMRKMARLALAYHRHLPSVSQSAARQPGSQSGAAGL